MANSARTRLNPDCAKSGICSSDDFTAACLGKAPLVIRNVQTDRRKRKPEFFACNSLVSYIGAPLLVKDQWLAIGLLGARFTSYEIEFFGSLMTRSLIALNAILSPVLALRTAPWDNSGQLTYLKMVLTFRDVDSENLHLLNSHCSLKVIKARDVIVQHLPLGVVGKV